LRAEVDGADRRNLWAHVDDDGSVRIEGQDLGPATAIVSPDGEYEWVHVIAVPDVPRLVALLGGEPGDDVLAVLSRYAGPASYELERLLRESDIEVRRSVW
jgi:hypothetical protein